MIDGLPVLDAVIHPYNMSVGNHATAFAGPIAEAVYASVTALSKPGYGLGRDEFMRDWSIEETSNMIFLESDTDLATYHVLPLYAYKDGLCSLQKGVEAKQRWPSRYVLYCGVDPLKGQEAIDELERQFELLKPIGLKLYPNSWVGSEARGWLMDDPEVAFPLFEKAQSLGIKVVAIHKAVPLGGVEMKHYRVDDVDRAAMTFPRLNFEIVHGGMAFLEETAWQLARFPNVWVNLEITTMLLNNRTRAFSLALSSLASVAGTPAFDRICWGTGAMATHPQPLLEKFVGGFQFEEDHLRSEFVGELKPLDRATKGKILFDNYERMTGLDLRSRLASAAKDEFGIRRRSRGGLAAPFSTTSVGPESGYA
jgi:predicted TIM-barrel fold metal-dependent hydrolase